MPDRGPTRIVILGGGFAGLSAARELERLLARDPNVEITLVNRENFFLFTPMLHEVAASDLDLATIVSPLRRMLKRTRLFIGTVEDIDVDAQTVTVSHAAVTIVTSSNTITSSWHSAPSRTSTAFRVSPSVHLR